MPGLRGFSATNLKMMRLFYEEWICLEMNSSVTTDELQLTKGKDNNNSSVIAKCGGEVERSSCVKI